MPPDPAFEATGSYTESTERLGVRRHSQCHVTLKGAKTTSQTDLAVACIAIVREKIRIANSVPIGVLPNGDIHVQAFPPIPEHFEFTCDMYNNTVSCNQRTMFRNAQLITLAFTGGLVTFTPGSQQGVDDFTPEYFDRGTASILLQAASYYDPSLPGNQLAANGNQATDDNLITLPGFVQMLQGRQPGTAGRNP